MNTEQWNHILKQISMLLYITKNIYKLSISSFSEQVFNLGFDINDIEVLNVDPVNTTLYIDEEWEERTGIYIMRECDLNEDGIVAEKEITGADEKEITGADGADGVDGADRADGADEADGADGADGADEAGADGADEADI
jgi:hypothetical protein